MNSINYEFLTKKKKPQGKNNIQVVVTLIYIINYSGNDHFTCFNK